MQVLLLNGQKVGLLMVWFEMCLLYLQKSMVKNFSFIVEKGLKDSLRSEEHKMGIKGRQRFSYISRIAKYRLKIYW